MSGFPKEAATSDTSQRFARCFRLTNAREFSRVFAKAARSQDRYYTVLYRRNDEPAARLGFAIAKKRISAATGRNRVRRVARESFRKIRAALPCLDIIILAQSAAAGASNRELFLSLDKHWTKLSAIESRQQQDQGHTNLNG